MPIVKLYVPKNLPADDRKRLAEVTGRIVTGALSDGTPGFEGTVRVLVIEYDPETSGNVDDVTVEVLTSIPLVNPDSTRNTISSRVAATYVPANCAPGPRRTTATVVFVPAL